MAATGHFHFEGSRLVFQPNYNDPRKKSETYYKDLMNQTINDKFNKSNKMLTKHIESINASSTDMNQYVNECSRPGTTQ